MKEQKKGQKPKPQEDENRQRTNTPTGQQEAPGKAQENPPRQNPPRPTDVDEEDEELDPRQRRPA
jgi:hypothetical protein